MHIFRDFWCPQILTSWIIKMFRKSAWFTSWIVSFSGAGIVSSFLQILFSDRERNRAWKGWGMRWIFKIFLVVIHFSQKVFSYCTWIWVIEAENLAFVSLESNWHFCNRSKYMKYVFLNAYAICFVGPPTFFLLIGAIWVSNISQ